MSDFWTSEDPTHRVTVKGRSAIEMPQLSESQKVLLRGLAAIPGLFSADDARDAVSLRKAGLLECKCFDAKVGLWIGKATDAGRKLAFKEGSDAMQKEQP